MARRRKVEYEVILEPSDEGGYTAYVPALRGCVSEGDNEEEALTNIKDAIVTWLDSWEQVALENGAVVKRVEILR